MSILRGHRYSVPAECCGQPLTVRLSLRGQITAWSAAGVCVATHHMSSGAVRDWVSVPAHHRGLWKQTLRVERRALATYQEAL